MTNIPRLYLFSALKMALFPMAIITLYWKDQLGLSLTQIMLLQAAFSAATLLSEYPSGYVGDLLGYRFSLSLASLLGILGWGIYTLASGFYSLLLAEILLGVSFAFTSGSDSALLYESLKAENRSCDYHRHDGWMNGWAQIGEAGGALFAGLMYVWFPLLPFLLQIGVWLTAFAVCRSLEETPVPSAPPDRNHLRAMADIASEALAKPGLRRSTIIYATILGLTSFYPVWLIQPWMQQNGVPVAWFGPIWAGANLTVAFFAILSHRAESRFGMRHLCWGFLLLVGAAYLGLGLFAGTGIFLFYYLLTMVRGLQGPLIRNSLQQASERRNRASLLSLKSFCFRLVFVVTAPLLGILADSRGMALTFLVLGGCFVLLLLPATRSFLFHQKSAAALE
jgi:MFS family permease